MGVRFTGGFKPNMSFRAGWLPTPVFWVTEPSVSVQYKQSTSIALSATGDLPLTYSLIDGSLPDGLSLVNGVITGKPTAELGNYSFTLRASSPYKSSDQTFNLEVVMAPPGPSQIVTGGSTASLVNWNSSNVRIDRNAFRITSPSGFMAQTTAKADLGKTYTVRAAYQDAINSSSNPASFSWTVKVGNTTLGSGTVNKQSYLTNGAQVLGTFVGTEDPVDLRITKPAGNDVLVFNISITRED